MPLRFNPGCGDPDGTGFRKLSDSERRRLGYEANHTDGTAPGAGKPLQLVWERGKRILYRGVLRIGDPLEQAYPAPMLDSKLDGTKKGNISGEGAPVWDPTPTPPPVGAGVSRSLALAFALGLVVGGAVGWLSTRLVEAPIATLDTSALR